jgi:hypothetical protein
MYCFDLPSFQYFVTTAQERNTFNIPLTLVHNFDVDLSLVWPALNVLQGSFLPFVSSILSATMLTNFLSLIFCHFFLSSATSP